MDPVNMPYGLMALIFQKLEFKEFKNIALTCKVWRNVVNDPEVQREVSKQVAFGPQEWSRHFGDVGESPLLPKNILSILTGQCPYWPNQAVGDTHLLVMIPKTVNEKPYTLDLVQELIEDKVATYDDLDPQKCRNIKEDRELDYLEVKNAIGKDPIADSYWVLLTKQVLPDSRKQNFDTQKGGLARFYSVPKTIEVATALITHFMRNGERLCSDVHTRCLETVKNYDSDLRIVVGSFNSFGIKISDADGGYGDDWKFDDCGLSGLRSFA